jgi:hypothetical protein
MPTDTQRAEWLKAEAMFETVTDAAALARWGSFAVARKSETALVYAADALAEAARQASFFAVPMAIDVHMVTGDLRGLLGRKLTLTIGQQGYDNGKDVIVLGVDYDQSQDVSQVRVLVRL